MSNCKKISFSGYRRYRLSILQGGDVNPALQPPCGSCTTCCGSYTSITLQDHELAMHQWLLADRPDESGRPQLQMRDDGYCVYHSEHGCTIYERRPQACRIYDCRDFAISGIQPTGELGRASVRAAEQTLTAKQQKDTEILCAVRMAAVAHCAEDPHNTVESASVYGLLMADKYVQVAQHLCREMDNIKNNDPTQFAGLMNELGEYLQATAGKSINAILGHSPQPGSTS